MKDKWGKKIKQIWTVTVEYTKKRAGTLAMFLGLLVLGVTVAAIFLSAPDSDTGKRVNNSKDERLEDAIERTEAPAETKEPEQEALLTAPPATAIPDFTKAPEETKSPGTKSLLSPPVSGRVIWDYAMDELIYSETLDQWMTHGGVDIACEMGSSIRTVKDGHVERVYKDDELGYTVIVEHKNGDRSIYAGLAGEELIAEGARVQANDVIGVCGNTAKSECALDVHIHFEYHVDGKPVNPADYILFTS